MNSQPMPALSWWDNHGTKILGTITAVLGAAVVGLPTLQPIMHSTPYAVVQFFLGIAVSALGAGTVKRGFTNSAASGS